MDDGERLAGHVEQHGPICAVAYPILGSLTEADDAVQDTWLRLSRSGAEDIENPGGWLTTIIVGRSRLAEMQAAVLAPQRPILRRGSSYRRWSDGAGSQSRQ